MDDELLRETKRFAAEHGRTVTSLVEDGLREILSRRAGPAAAGPIRLHTVAGSGLRAGVDLDDSVALLEHMDEDG
ncbi:MAG: hypothetical protein U5S82_20835 [Gammaproteobacteria bacterium]|nr:hypothetical protein [Gammaproteobacteria bacterium]